MSTIPTILRSFSGRRVLGFASATSRKSRRAGVILQTKDRNVAPTLSVANHGDHFSSCSRSKDCGNCNWNNIRQQQLHPRRFLSSSKNVRKEDSGSTVFDPLLMPSSTILKQSDTELTSEEIALKQALQEYQEFIRKDEQDKERNELLRNSLDDLFDAYHSLEYWEEALGVEKLRWKLYSSCQDTSSNNNDESQVDDSVVFMDRYADSIHVQAKLYLRQGDFRTSYELYHKAVDYYIRSGNEIQRGHVLMSLAGWHYFRNELHAALDLLQESEPLLETNPTLLVKNLDNAGLVLRSMGEYKQALDKYEEALQLVGQDMSSIVTRFALRMHIADMWSAMGDSDAALELYQDILQDLQQEPTSQNASRRGVLLHNIANLHVEQGEYDLALEEFNQALQLKIHSGGENHPEVAKTWNSMGALYASVLDKKAQALECFQQALNIARINSDNEESDPDVLFVLRNMTALQQQQQDNPSV